MSGAGGGVGLVLVSHSRLLAEGLLQLLDQVVQGRVPVAAVGGAEDGSLGTDALAVGRAVESLSACQGIVVLADLGSAVMSAETAMEQLPSHLRGRTVLADAAFVEGALAAAVEASLGSGVGRVLEVAEAAGRQAKLA